MWKPKVGWRIWWHNHVKRHRYNLTWNYWLRHRYGAGPSWSGAITPEALAWAESVMPEIEEYKAANPNWLEETRPVSELLAKRPKR